MTIPIKVLPATESHSISFHQVHKTDGGRIRYQKVGTLGDKVLGQKEIGRGYGISKDTVIPITDADLDAMPLPTAKAIEVVAFAPADTVDPKGAHVGFCGERADSGRQVEREIRDASGEATYIQADVRIAAQVQSFVNRVASRYGGIDMAFNNAGIGSGELPHETSVEEWDDVQATNARGVFLAIKYEIPHMLRAQRGVIICTSSSAAGQARPNGAAYSASKRAVQGMVKSTALAYGPKESGSTPCCPAPPTPPSSARRESRMRNGPGTSRHGGRSTSMVSSGWPRPRTSRAQCSGSRPTTSRT